jgi:two-component system response regulator FixJ
VLLDESKILIYVVDDDASARQALEMLLISANMEVQAFERAKDLLKCMRREDRACLIADIKMKGLDGLELQQKLAESAIKIPVIFITALDSNETRQQAKQAGAVGYFRKPVDDQALLDTIQWALTSCSSSKAEA